MDVRQRMISQDVLETLIAIESNNQTYLMKDLGLTDYLVEQGYLGINKIGINKRSDLLELTPKGKKLYNNLLERINEDLKGFPKRKR